MSLRDFKIPNFKFPKLKMKDIENIEEVNVEIDPKKINERNKKSGTDSKNCFVPDFFAAGSLYISAE